MDPELGESFWDLHRRLGECYNQDLMQVQQRVETLLSVE